MTTTSEEDDLWYDEGNGSDELLNEPERPSSKNEDKDYEMPDHSICNKAIAEPMNLPTLTAPKGSNDMEWIKVVQALAFDDH